MKKIVLIITLLCLSYGVHANEFMFKHLEVKDGLSNNQVLDIYRDSEGFMWFATASGLNRYDGYEMTVFRSYNKDPNSLPDNYIQRIQEDNKKNLWILTRNGYAIYNPESETFNRDVHGWLWEIGIDGNAALVYIDRNKNMWFYVEDKGCYLYIPESQLLYPLLFDAQQLPTGKITDIAECKDGVLLVYNTGLLVCLDIHTNKIKWQLQDLPKELGADKKGVFTLFVDAEDDTWIYSPLGLWVYNPERKKWQSHLRDIIKHQSVDNRVCSIAQDNRGCIWIGKERDGIDILNKETGEIKHLHNKLDDERSLQNNTITALYLDPNETMWAGTYRNGVSYYNESLFKFGIEHVGDISCIEEDKNGYVWLGTNNGEIIYRNVITGEQTALPHVAGNERVTDAIACMLKANDRKLWIGTLGAGLDCNDNGRIIHYKNAQGQKNALANNNICALAEDKDGNIWIGTLGGGLQSLNPKAGVFTTYDINSTGLLSNSISSLCMGNDNLLWIGTDRGLSVLDLGTKKIIGLVGTKSGREHFSNQDIIQVYEDSRGLIWVGTREGLNIYNPKTDELNILNMEDGLSGSIISGIAEDSNKNIWVTTSRGATNIVLTMDSKTGRYNFRNYIYDDKDGLQNCEFNPRSIKKISTGEILMGGLYGINRFNPDDIKYNKVLPKVIFTQLMLFNDEVKVGKKYGDRVILSKALNLVDQVELSYKQNIFSVQFASDNYILPEKMKYAYKLEGFKDEWLTGTVGKMTYTNLAPGTYTLKVKAINNDGYSSDKEASLKIVVHPPFLLSIWAYIIYGLLFVVALILARHFVVRNERKKLKQQFSQEVETADSFEVFGRKEAVEMESENYQSEDDEPEGDKSAEVIEAEEDTVEVIRSTEETFSQIEQDSLKDESVEEMMKEENSDNEENEDGGNVVEEIDTLFATAQRATVIQLIENDADEIITHIVPPEELPDIVTATNKGRKSIAPISLAAKDLIGGKKSVANEAEKRPLVLIVDDNDDFLTFMYDALYKKYRVKPVADGREAWELIPELMPDIIVSDGMMSGMNGDELCSLVKGDKHTANIPFILLMARESDESKLERITIGADKYISKPFNMDVLNMEIQKLLDLKAERLSSQIDVEPSEIILTSTDEKLLDHAVKYVEDNISRSDLSVEELSRELGMSRVHLYKKLLAITGKTPIEFIRVIRLKRAAQLLRESQQNISEIAYQMGFNNPKYFSKYFKEEFGVLPSVYQEKRGEL